MSIQICPVLKAHCALFRIVGLNEKVSWLKHYCVIALQIKRSDFFELSFLRLYSILLIDSFPY